MRAFVAGGAGFIGSHTVARLLRDPRIEGVTVYDNFTSGRKSNVPSANSSCPKIVEADLRDMHSLCDAMKAHDIVFHYASNPDIARAIQDPDIDFWQGTLLTHNVLEAARQCGVRMFIYASGSGVYGDTGSTPVHEDYAPMLPISTYGASKLAGEALICAYSSLFDIQSWVFRFANVVGPRQTHGVAYDFIRKLKTDPTRLQILGNGKQSKSYIHIDDVLNGIWLVWQKALDTYNYFNLATDDHIAVSEIAVIVARCMGLDSVMMEYTGGERGWKGDVPVTRWDTRKIKQLGWQARFGSRESIETSVRQMLMEADFGPTRLPNGE